MARRRSGPSGTTYAIRLLVALGLGAAIGGATGVLGVRRLEPGRPGQPDSLQAMLDSLRLRQAQDPRMQRRAVDSADADRRSRREADSLALANDPTAPIIPLVAHLDEGAARTLLESAGVVVAAVVFEPSADSAGVAQRTIPAAGLKVKAGAGITLVVSNGKRPGDTTTGPVPPPPPFSQP